MAWYIRNQNKVIGPFPAGHIQQSILLGRIALDDQASKDKQDWVKVRSCAELIPDVLRLGRNIENREERIEAAKRWADERRYERRDGEEPDRHGPGRRDIESFTTTEYREHRETVLAQSKVRRDKGILGIILVTVVLVLGVVAAFLFPTPEQEIAQCTSPAAGKVNWQNCQLVGLQSLNSNLDDAVLANANLESANLMGSSIKKADLSYINFRHANLTFVNLSYSRLIGADLRNADLSNVNFKGADLSYANLTGATLSDTDFDGAIMKNMIWINGEICTPESVGRCQTSQ